VGSISRVQQPFIKADGMQLSRAPLGVSFNTLPMFSQILHRQRTGGLGFTQRAAKQQFHSRVHPQQLVSSFFPVGSE